MGCFQKFISGAKERASQLRVVAAFAEHLSSVPSIYARRLTDVFNYSFRSDATLCLPQTPV